jgi:hypothetical protein
MERRLAMKRAICGWAVGLTLAMGMSVLVAGCGAKVEGTYSNANGLAMLELKSGGKATVSLMGQASDCTYLVNENQVVVNCGGDKSVYRVNGDGSLTGPGFIGVMKKEKS